MVIVESRREGAVRDILLNRVEKRNALDIEMLAALEEVFSRPPEPHERLAVLRAAGPVFCAGLDLRGTAGREKSAIEPMLRALEVYPLPVVALVQGDAIAGGCELALHCDIVIASQRARFGMSNAQIGLPPNWFLTKKLLETAGPVMTRQILFLGDPVSSTRLAELGVIAQAVPPEELESAGEKVIDRLARNAPLALKAMKAVIVRSMTFRDHIENADVEALVLAAKMSRDCKEGMAARLEKREPRFEGR